MSILRALLAWANPTFGKPQPNKKRGVSPRHPTKKGPGRSKGSDPMSSLKKKYGTTPKLPKHIPSGIAPQGRYRKGENPIGTNVRA